MNQPESQHPALKLHHIGIVVPRIEEAVSAYRLLGYTERTGIIHDPAQTALLQFLRLSNADHYIELVAPDGPDSYVAAAAARKNPLNHLCYTSVDIFCTCNLLQSGGWRLISDPAPAVAFDGRLIAWLISPAKLIVELVQQGPEGSL